MNDAELQAALAARLVSLSRDEPDLAPDVRAAQRARLVAMAAVRPVGAGAAAVRTPVTGPSRWQRLLAGPALDAAPARWRTRLTAGLVGAALSVGALSGLVALAQDAEPGDLLYGLKRGSEQTQLALASDEDRGLTLLTFASTRLAELAELTGSDVGAGPVSVGAVDASGLAVAAAGADAGTVVDVLTTMDAQTVEGTSALTATAVRAGDERALRTLAGWTTGQRAGLVGLDVPAGAGTRVAESLALVDEVAARAEGLQADLACPAGAAEAGADRLGPRPGGCLAASAPAPTSSGPSSGTPSRVPSGARPAPRRRRRRVRRPPGPARRPSRSRRRAPPRSRPPAPPLRRAAPRRPVPPAGAGRRRRRSRCPARCPRCRPPWCPPRSRRWSSCRCRCPRRPSASAASSAPGADRRIPRGQVGGAGSTRPRPRSGSRAGG